MSYVTSIYEFFLNEPLTFDKLEAIYTEFEETDPALLMMAPKEDMVRFSLNRPTHRERIESDNLGLMDLGDSTRLFIVNHPNMESGEYGCFFRLGKGDRQMRVYFYSPYFMSRQVEWNPELGTRLLPLFVIVAKHSDPFLGFYWDESDLPYLEKNPDLRGLDSIRSYLSQSNGNVGSFYFDIDLIDGIGSDVLDQWAKLRTEVEGRGFFIERSGLPFNLVDVQEEGQSFRAMNDLFAKSIYPRVIERLRREFHIRPERVSSINVNYHPYGFIE